MDENGYPEEDELKALVEWPHTDFKGLLEEARRLWHWGPDMWKVRGRRYTVSTGGWSGNEDIIDAMQHNFIFWALCWDKSARGGHYVFVLPPKAKTRPPVRDC